MPQISPSLVSLLLLFLSLYCNLISCIESEAQALLTWRSSLKNHGNLTEMWSDQLSSDPCRWDGIECNDAGSITSFFYCGFGPFAICEPVDGPPIDGTLLKFNFSSFPNLTEFRFENNNLHGEIPEAIGSLHNLKTLDLSYNSFTGAFPTAILNLSNIENLVLWNNKFTGVIPVEISKLSNIYQLDLLDNNFVGEIPASIGNLSRLSLLSLDYNYFTGTIPREIGHLNELDFLSLSRNRLSGQIPLEIGNLITRLKTIDFAYNKLQGEVPTLNADIYELELRNNQLTGLPYLGNYSKLSFIDLSSNRFTGTVPPFICRGVLEYFFASNNNFDNLLLITLQNCTNLEVLCLGNNSIKANISYIFDNLPELRYLDLSLNCFYGSLPSSLDGKHPPGFGNTTRWEVVNLDSNNLTGAIPTGFINFPDLSILILSNNKFSSLPMISATKFHYYTIIAIVLIFEIFIY